MDSWDDERDSEGFPEMKDSEGMRWERFQGLTCSDATLVWAYPKENTVGDHSKPFNTIWESWRKKPKISVIDQFFFKYEKKQSLIFFQIWKKIWPKTWWFFFKTEKISFFFKSEKKQFFFKFEKKTEFRIFFQIWKLFLYIFFLKKVHTGMSNFSNFFLYITVPPEGPCAGEGCIAF